MQNIKVFKTYTEVFNFLNLPDNEIEILEEYLILPDEDDEHKEIVKEKMNLISLNNLVDLSISIFTDNNIKMFLNEIPNLELNSILRILLKFKILVTVDMWLII